MDNITEEILPLLKDNEVILLDPDYNLQEIIELIISKHSPHDAFYIINLGSIIRKYKQWKEIFPNIQPYYALKSNPNPVICRLLASLGAGFDVASVEEINLVKDFVDMSKIVYANPIKQCSSIQYARTVDVDTLVIDSETELTKVKIFHSSAKLLIRLKVCDTGSTCQFSSKFGIEREDLEKLLILAKTQELNVIGFSFHIGSGTKNPSLYYSALEFTKYAFNVSEQLGMSVYLIDIGGGFPGLNDDVSNKLLLDIRDFINKGLVEFFSDYEEEDTTIPPTNPPTNPTTITTTSSTTVPTIPTNSSKKYIKIIAEPGRYMVTTSHTLVVSVIGRKMKFIKTEDGKVKVFDYFINEGTYQSFGCINYDYQVPQLIPYNNDEKDLYLSNVWGPTCDSLDKISSNILLPELLTEDRIYVPNFGAYTVASSSSFNGFTRLKNYYVLN